MLKLLTLAALGASTVQAGYAPSYVACPSDGSAALRLAGTPAEGNQTLNTAEAEYTSSRRPLADAALREWLSQGNLTSKVYGGSFDSVNATGLPTIGISLSGGGNRAALFGAGVLSAFDGRNSTSVSKGTGGLLQAATYLSGLSGGSWLLSSLTMNDFPEIYPMVLGDGTNSSALGWNLEQDLFAPGTGNQSTEYVQTLFAALVAKKLAGNFNVTINDMWARALSYHFLPGTTMDNFFNASADHAASLLLSSATSLSSWTNHSMPFPIILADAFTVNTKDKPLPDAWVPITNVGYEITPLEFGSFDPELASFVPLKFLGTAMTSGTPVDGGEAGNCVSNFDNAGFLIGASSLVFHAYNVSESIEWTNAVSPINQLWTTINTTFYGVQPMQQIDCAALGNPFRGLRPETYEDTSETQLRLVDGGYDGAVSPVGPLLIKKRAIDVIIVADASADSSTQTPTGASLVATLERSKVLPEGTVSLPPLPTSNTTYVDEGLVTRPVFFGCSTVPANLSGNATATDVPFIVYIPNYDYGQGITNTSTGQLVYSNAEATSFLDTASAIAYSGAGGNDTEWATCLACAVVERTRGREGVDRTSACAGCFERYCWDGVEASAGGNGSTGAGGGGGATGTNGTSGGQTPASAAGRAFAGEWTAVKLAVGLGAAGLALLW